MSNFGLRHLRVVNPYELAFREARSAIGASQIMREATEFVSVAEAVGDCSVVIGTTALRNRELQHPIHSLVSGSRILRRQLSPGRVALLFGSEKRGLSNEDLSHCHWLMHIPTREEHPSMNLGQAVAVCLYEITRLPHSAKSTSKGSLARSLELERLTTVLSAILAKAGYLKNPTDKNAAGKLRRFVRSLELSEESAQTLLGMFRQIGWKLEKHKTG